MQSGELFASGVDRYDGQLVRFRRCLRAAGLPGKGKVAIAPVPVGPGYSSGVPDRLLAVGDWRRQQHKDLAYAFMRYCASAAVDKMTTLAGGIGCRRCTWTDPEVNAPIPFFHRLAEFHEGTRELPVRAPGRVVHIIDPAVQEAIGHGRIVRCDSARARSRQRAAIYAWRIDRR